MATGQGRGAVAAGKIGLLAVDAVGKPAIIVHADTAIEGATSVSDPKFGAAIGSAVVVHTRGLLHECKLCPRMLVIVLEEAHKLLNREMASQTAFSTIAREMRKYYVTLLVIDQRPSQIYDEVMSQLGTRISGWLGDDADISAVLSGLAGRDSLRGMLARLQPKEEVLLLGWGVPMPLPIRSRRYDARFWEELLKNQRNNSQEDILKALGF